MNSINPDVWYITIILMLAAILLFHVIIKYQKQPFDGKTNLLTNFKRYRLEISNVGNLYICARHREDALRVFTRQVNSQEDLKQLIQTQTNFDDLPSDELIRIELPMDWR